MDEIEEKDGNTVSGPDAQLKDQVPLQLDDGSETPIADSSEVDAVKQSTPIKAEFASGNLGELTSIGQKFTAGVLSVTNTLVPLIEAALIELTGNSSAYTRESALISPKIVGTTPTFEFQFAYKVSLWIGTDIPKDPVLQDANYVYEKISALKSATFDECKIDTSTGTLSISGTLSER